MSQAQSLRTGVLRFSDQTRTGGDAPARAVLLSVGPRVRTQSRVSSARPLFAHENCIGVPARGSMHDRMRDIVTRFIGSYKRSIEREILCTPGF